jgi:hypothetical protein
MGTHRSRASISWLGALVGVVATCSLVLLVPSGCSTIPTQACGEEPDVDVCGRMQFECGKVVVCFSCADTQTCGGGGVPHVCWPPLTDGGDEAGDEAGGDDAAAASSADSSDDGSASTDAASDDASSTDASTDASSSDASTDASSDAPSDASSDASSDATTSDTSDASDGTAAGDDDSGITVALCPEDAVPPEDAVTGDDAAPSASVDATLSE